MHQFLGEFMIVRTTRIVSGLILGFLIAQSTAATSLVNLRGKVVDASQNGLPGVTISIKDMDYSAITDAQGNWSIGASAPIELKENDYSSIDLFGQNLQLNLGKSGPVKIDIVDLFGKQSKTIMNETLNGGQYNVNLGATDFAKGVWLVRVQSTQESKVLRWINTENNNQKAAVVSSSRHRPSILTKGIGEQDSLIITYQDKEVSRREQANLLAGTLPDFILCGVTPAISPTEAGTIQQELPIYILFGDSITVNFTYDENMWRPQKLIVGGDIFPASGSEYRIGLSSPNDGVTLTMATRDQSISFSDISDKVFGVGSFVVGAQASSGQPVTLESVTYDVCYASGDSILVVGTGVCEFYATQTGDEFFNPVQIDTSFVVSVGTQVVSIDSIANLTFGESSFEVTASTTSGLSLYFESITPSICTVDQYLVSMNGAGACTIKATPESSPNYQTTSGTRTFQINKATQTIAFEDTTGKVYGDASFDLGALATSELPVFLSSNTPTVCTASDSMVTLLSGGTCTLYASQVGNANYSATSTTIHLPIAKADQQLSFIPMEDTTYKAATLIPVVTSTALGLPIVISSGTPTVCSVTSNIVTMLKSGSCELTASQAGDSKYNATVSDIESFEIYKADQTISFTPINDTPLSSPPFTPTVTASSGLPVFITSLDNNICTVTNNLVTVITAEGCRLLGTQAGDDRYNAVEVETSFNSIKKSQTITLTTPVSKNYGDADFDLVATTNATPTPIPVTLTSITDAVCLVNGNTVTVISVGTCSIQATAEADGSYFAAQTVVKSFPVNKATQIVTIDPVASFTFGDLTSFAVSAVASSGLTPVFTSTTTTVCTVTGTTVSVVGVGTCIIRATQAGSTLYNSGTSTVSVTIAKANQTINTFALDSKIYGATGFTLVGSAVSTSGLAIAYTSATPTICTVSSNVLYMLTSGTCTVNANQAGNANYFAALTESSSFTVYKAPQTITFNPIGNKTFGVATFYVTSLLSATSGLAPVLTSLTPDVCVVNAMAISIVGAGSCNLQADQPGDGKYEAASTVSQSFTVAQLAQTISFGTITTKTLSLTPQFTLSGTASSGLPLFSVSQTPMVCTVDGSSVTLDAKGTCTLTLSQSGNQNFLPATAVSQSFIVN
jgi:hypothetical protein